MNYALTENTTDPEFYFKKPQLITSAMKHWYNLVHIFMFICLK